MKKLLVTGAGGLLGKAICTVAQNDFDVISLKREDCDLINFQDTKAIFNYVKIFC